MGKFDSARREILKNAGLAGVGALTSGFLLNSAAKAAGNIKTPPQTEGPFYPILNQLDKDADMTHVKGHAEFADGQRILLNGVLLDADTREPIAGAMVEFWQACASGKYDHPNDSNTAPLDPHFQYWAQVITNNSGQFRVLSIKPGAYPASEGWDRPPHIHVKVHKAGYPSLTTQLYFKGDPLNEKDLILKKISPAERHLVVVDFAESPEVARGTLEGAWSIYIGKFLASGGRSTVSGRMLSTPEIE